MEEILIENVLNYFEISNDEIDIVRDMNDLLCEDRENKELYKEYRKKRKELTRKVIERASVVYAETGAKLEKVLRMDKVKDTGTERKKVSTALDNLIKDTFYGRGFIDDLLIEMYKSCVNNIKKYSDFELAQYIAVMDVPADDNETLPAELKAINPAKESDIPEKVVKPKAASKKKGLQKRFSGARLKEYRKEITEEKEKK
jgi:hypothetical protein